MPSTFKPFESYFSEMGQPAGSPIGGTEYDLSGDTAPTPTAASSPSTPASQPATAPQVDVFGTGQGGSTATATAPQAAPQSTAPAAANPFATGGQSSTSIGLNPFSLPAPQNPLYGKLFGGIGTQAQGTQKKLGETTQAFTTAAGPSRTYESVDAPQSLERSLAWAHAPGGDAGNQLADRDIAMGLLGAKYEGPQGLEQGAVDTLSTDIGQLGTRVGSLRTGSGASDLLGGLVPGLTMGQTRMESQRMLADPEYRAQVAAHKQAVRGLGGDLTRAQAEAQAIAAQRTGEEEGISRMSREYLTGDRAGIDQALEEVVARERAIEAEKQAAYDKFRASGSMDDLSALDQLSDLDFSGFNTELQGRNQEALAKKASIMGDPRFAAIADVPLMTLGLNSHARETLMFDPTWWAENEARFPARKPKNAPGVITRDELKALARERQLLLEQEGFSPGSWARGDRKATSQVTGERSTFDPLYFGQNLPEFAAMDPSAFITKNESSDPSKDALATVDQRQRFNAINDLLGEASRLQEVDPYRASEFTSELDRYIAEEQRAYDLRQAQIEDERLQWAGVTNKARKGHTQAKRAKLAGQVGTVIGGTLGLGLGGVGAVGGALLGEYIGQQAAGGGGGYRPGQSAVDVGKKSVGPSVGQVE